MGVLGSILGAIIVIVGLVIMVGPFLVPPILFFSSILGTWGQVALGLLLVVGGAETMVGH